MSTVLTNGIIIPENGSRNWSGDLANNWNILDVNVGYMTDVKNRVTTLENSVAENTANIQINASNISTLQTSKQDTIEDLETIRSGASAGATAVQPSGGIVTGDLVGVGDNNLGTTTAKWKTINGVNPGALSFPNSGDGVDVTSQVVNTNGVFQYTNNFYDGWLIVTAVADNVQISNQGLECRAVKSIDSVTTVNIALRVTETVNMRFTNFANFVYVKLYACVGG